MSKKIRQGQTVYHVHPNMHKGPNALATVEKYFIYSNRIKLPPPHLIIKRMPVNEINFLIGKGVVFYKSRRKAISNCKQRNLRTRKTNVRDLLMSLPYYAGVNYA